MLKTCQACGGTVCEVCGGCIAHGECSCIEDRIQKYIDRAEVAEARLQLTEKNAAKIVDQLERIKKVLLEHDLFDLWRYPDLPQAIDFLCGKAERAMQAHGVVNAERARLGVENYRLKEWKEKAINLYPDLERMKE